MTEPCPITLNHGVIGNGRVLALVSPSTNIDWLCMPRFDSASVFGRILDVEKGGTFTFQTDAPEVDTRMEYVLDTNVLRTAVACPEGRFDLYDYAPRIPSGLDVEAPIEIQRLVVPREGAARVRVQFDPKPDYAVNQHPKVSEDIEPRTGMLLGNFPQAYTHVGLINTAVTISEMLEARDARFRAWS